MIKKIIAAAVLCLLTVCSQAQTTPDGWIWITQGVEPFIKNNIYNCNFVPDASSKTNGYLPVHLTANYEQYGICAGKKDKNQLCVVHGTDTLLQVPSVLKGEEGVGVAIVLDAAMPDLTDMDSCSVATIGEYGYGTFASAWSCVVPEGSNVYMPVTTATGRSLKITSMRRVTPGTLIPSNAGVIIKAKANSTLKLPISTTTNGGKSYTALSKSALTGNSLTLDAKRVKRVLGKNVLTFGKAKGQNRYGFYQYVGDTLYPSKAYILK